MKNDNNSFSYSYSGATKAELEQLKEKYAPEHTTEKMKRIHALDKRVDFLATMISILLGIAGTAALIPGVMWLIQVNLSDSFGIFLTVIGITVISCVPFFHSKVLALIKKIYAPEILRLISEIEESQL